MSHSPAWFYWRYKAITLNFTIIHQTVPLGSSTPYSSVMHSLCSSPSTSESEQISWLPGRSMARGSSDGQVHHAHQHSNTQQGIQDDALFNPLARASQNWDWLCHPTLSSWSRNSMPYKHAVLDLYNLEPLHQLFL